jgi:hypothetical protein
MFISPELEIAAISAGAALLIGGAVALFGHRAVLTAAWRIGRVIARRRFYSSLVLGALASGGLVAANATGLEPTAAGDAFSFFQNNLAEALHALGG